MKKLHSVSLVTMIFVCLLSVLTAFAQQDPNRRSAPDEPRRPARIITPPDFNVPIGASIFGLTLFPGRYVNVEVEYQPKGQEGWTYDQNNNDLQAPLSYFPFEWDNDTGKETIIRTKGARDLRPRDPQDSKINFGDGLTYKDRTSDVIAYWGYGFVPPPQTPQKRSFVPFAVATVVARKNAAYALNGSNDDKITIPPKSKVYFCAAFPNQRVIKLTFRGNRGAEPFEFEWTTLQGSNGDTFVPIIRTNNYDVPEQITVTAQVVGNDGQVQKVPFQTLRTRSEGYLTIYRAGQTSGAGANNAFIDALLVAIALN